MEMSLFEKIIKELEPYVYNLNLYFQGEPMLHPEFLSEIDRKNSYYSVDKWSFLSEENADKLAFQV